MPIPFVDTDLNQLILNKTALTNILEVDWITASDAERTTWKENTHLLDKDPTGKFAFFQGWITKAVTDLETSGYTMSIAWTLNYTADPLPKSYSFRGAWTLTSVIT